MDRNDATWVMAELYRRWPKEPPFPSPTEDLWLDKLETIPTDVAAAALSVLFDRSEFRPSWAAFHTACQDELGFARARRASADTLVLLAGAGLPTTSETDKRWVAAINAALAEKARHTGVCRTKDEYGNWRECADDCEWNRAVTRHLCHDRSYHFR